MVTVAAVQTTSLRPGISRVIANSAAGLKFKKVSTLPGSLGCFQLDEGRDKVSKITDWPGSSCN